MRNKKLQEVAATIVKRVCELMQTSRFSQRKMCANFLQQSRTPIQLQMLLFLSNVKAVEQDQLIQAAQLLHIFTFR